MQCKRVIRVGVSTNWTGTEAERRELEARLRPGDRAFANVNGETPLTDGSYPIVVTLNPYLDRFRAPKWSPEALVQIRVARIKWVPCPTGPVRRAFGQAVRWAESRRIPILITRMRFFRREMLLRYCADPRRYVREHGQYYPTGLPERKPGWYVCDELRGGCPDCRLCSVLTVGNTILPYGLNLRASIPTAPSPKGFHHCTMDCPECWAARALARGGGLPKTIIYRNAKQRGHERHR